MQSTVLVSAGCLCHPCPGWWPATLCPQHPLLLLPCSPLKQTCQTSCADYESHHWQPAPATPQLGSHLTWSQCHSHCCAPLQKHSCRAQHGCVAQDCAACSTVKGDIENIFVCFQVQTAPLSCFPFHAYHHYRVRVLAALKIHLCFHLSVSSCSQSVPFLNQELPCAESCRIRATWTSKAVRDWNEMKYFCFGQTWLWAFLVKV